MADLPRKPNLLEKHGSRWKSDICGVSFGIQLVSLRNV